MTIDITEHLPLVGWVVDRYYVRCIGGRIEREDLVSEGYVGLVKAAEKFDPARGCAFSTYAVYWVRHYIQRYMHNHGRLVRVPTYLQDRQHAKQLPSERLLWLDSTYGDSSGGAAHDFMGSDDNAQRRVPAALDVERLLVHIKDKRARFAVRQWYLKDRTLEEIGANIGGITRERVRQLVLRGLDEMRQRVQGRGRIARSVMTEPQSTRPNEQQEARWREALSIYRSRSTDNNSQQMTCIVPC
jgi:RNA polymerase sigma factor (sigma-70 family)